MILTTYVCKRCDSREWEEIPGTCLEIARYGVCKGCGTHDHIPDKLIFNDRLDLQKAIKTLEEFEAKIFNL